MQQRLVVERRAPETIMHGLPLRRGGRQINRDPVGICIVGVVKNAVKACRIIACGMRHLNHRAPARRD